MVDELDVMLVDEVRVDVDEPQHGVGGDGDDELCFCACGSAALALSAFSRNSCCSWKCFSSRLGAFFTAGAAISFAKDLNSKGFVMPAAGV